MGSVTLSGTDRCCAEIRVLRELLRMRSRRHLFGGPYSLVGDEEVRGEWRRLRTEELHDLYC
jgi:hypothetical protein